MAKPASKLSPKAIRHLSKNLGVEMYFVQGCLEAAAIEVYERKGRFNLADGSALRLRRLQRLCLTFEVDLHVALLLTQVIDKTRTIEGYLERR